MQNKQKLTYGIKGKLISATAMLLVALIMVVSSSYAWFTLSTAPEVTGINTAVGANGALEMALRYNGDVKEGQVSGDSNLYWGNLVNLDKNSHGINYGVELITLLPSMLNVSGTGLSGTPLQTPEYGADGRVSILKPNSILGTYDDTKENFYPSNGLGFRAVGTASGMTDRQLGYRNAKSNAATATAQATNMASSSLKNNGGTLANIAVKKAMSTGDSYTQEDVSALLAIVNDLLGTDTKTGAIQYIEKAYVEYIRMYVAGTSGGASDDATWKLMDSAIAGGGDLFTMFDSDTGVFSVGEVSVVLPASLSDPIKALAATKAKVVEAKTALDDMADDGADATFNWDTINVPLYKLADINNMEINGIKASEANDKMSDIVNGVASQGVSVTMKSGGGVYADIADHCGDYSTAVVIEQLSSGGFTVNNVNAKMSTASTVSPAHLVGVGNNMSTLSPAPSSEGGEAKPFTEYYGFILDLAFRTNAKESNLLLQTEAIDRIYDDNTNDATMGHGSTMTFKSTSGNFDDIQVAALMKHIRLVFFTPNDDAETGGIILAYAKLNMDSGVTTDANGVTAGIYLYTSSYTTDASGNYLDESGAVAYYKYDGKYYSVANWDATNSVPVANATESTTFEKAATTETTLEGTNAVITALTQNTQHNVSVLVYLDGTTITNADVAYDAATSMTGTMNLQFASSANLVPMEYADLHTPGANTNTSADANTSTDAGTQGN